MLVILKTHRDVLEQYQDRFKYILVDAYQDTNASQYLWLRLLAQARKNICVVGDDDQSVYSWRGAEVANILRFDKDFRSEEHTTELQSLMRISYAVFCLKKKKTYTLILESYHKSVHNSHNLNNTNIV